MPGRATTRALVRAGVSAALVLACTACAHGEAATASGPLFRRLYPLDAGRSWTFQVARPGVPGTTTTVTRVDGVDGKRVTLRSATLQYTYEIRVDGIYRLRQGAYLLRAPISADATWPGPFGGHDRVTAFEKKVTVPAGTFENCVVVDETVPAARIRLVHTFCPGVGPVRLVQYADGAKVAEGVLAAYGKTAGPGK